MKTPILVAACVAFTSMGTLAYAGDGAVTGAAGGAVTGAIVGGPVGAVVGGAAGLTLGSAIDPPPGKVVTYVEQQPIPQDPIVIQQPIAVGKPLPGAVVVQPVPGYDSYGYAIVNDQRVIVDPETNTVLQVVE